MAKLRKKTKGAVPAMEDASDNLTPPVTPVVKPVTVKRAPTVVIKQQQEELKPLNFKVPASFKKEYKQFALDHDLSLVDILKLSFSKYKEITK